MNSMLRDLNGDGEKGGGKRDNTQNRTVKEAYRLLYEEEVQSRLVSQGSTVVGARHGYREGRGWKVVVWG